MGDYYNDNRDDRRGGGGGSRYDYDEPQRIQKTRKYPRRADDADYVEETTFIERGKGRPPQDLVYRGRDRDDSVEDINRDFSPPSGRRNRGYDDYGPQRSRSMNGRRRRDDYDSDDDYYGAAGGAAAGYAAGRARNGGRGRRESYSDDDRSPPRRKKSGIESTLEGLGLGGVAGALLGKDKDKDRDRSRSRGPGGRDRSRSQGNKKQREWAQAAQAALIAGAVEAFKSRGAPGPWTGDKGKRIATAAIGAGGIDKLVDRDPNDKSKRHLVEAVLGGLAANRLANGPARSGSEERGRSGSRSRSRGGDRSRSRSVWSRYRGRRSSDDDQARGTTQSDKFKDLAAGGVLAGVGKQLYDRFRSKSRGPRGRSPSESGSEDSYRSKSRRRDRDVGQGPYSQNRGGPNDGAVVAANRGTAASRGPGDRNQHGGAAEDRLEAHLGESVDSESTTDMENKKKKMRGKEYITAALASIATIHAAHGVYQSMESSDKRHKMVEEGEMTPEEARKKRSKAWLQDAAAVGIAALGIKGAYSEWREMNEQRHELKELEERKRKRDKRQRQRQKQGYGDGGPYMSGGNGGRYNGYDDGYQNGGRLPPPPTGYGR